MIDTYKIILLTLNLLHNRLLLNPYSVSNVPSTSLNTSRRHFGNSSQDLLCIVFYFTFILKTLAHSRHFHFWKQKSNRTDKGLMIRELRKYGDVVYFQLPGSLSSGIFFVQRLVSDKEHRRKLLFCYSLSFWSELAINNHVGVGMDEKHRFF